MSIGFLRLSKCRELIAVGCRGAFRRHRTDFAIFSTWCRSRYRTYFLASTRRSCHLLCLNLLRCRAMQVLTLPGRLRTNPFADLLAASSSKPLLVIQRRRRRCHDRRHHGLRRSPCSLPFQFVGRWWWRSPCRLRRTCSGQVFAGRRRRLRADFLESRHNEEGQPATSCLLIGKCKL